MSLTLLLGIGMTIFGGGLMYLDDRKDKKHALEMKKLDVEIEKARHGITNNEEES